jgi:hypothetical protein
LRWAGKVGGAASGTSMRGGTPAAASSCKGLLATTAEIEAFGGSRHGADSVAPRWPITGAAASADIQP